MENIYDISVVIPSYNSKETITQCLNSVLNQNYKETYEIIVVDSSDDDTPAIVKSHFPNVKLIHFHKKTDPGTARNTGANSAKGHILAFIDSDCIASIDWLRQIKQRHDEGYSAVGGAVLNANPHSIISWASYIIEFSSVFPNGEGIRLVSHIPSCNISYKAKLFKLYKGFSSTMYPGEDRLFNWKLYMNKESILFDPNIIVSHYHRESIFPYIHHQIRKGSVTVKLRYKMGKSDSIIVKNKIIAFCALPFLLIIKGCLNIYRLLKWKPNIILSLPLYLPAFCLGLFFWGFGFIKEVNCQNME